MNDRVRKIRRDSRERLESVIDSFMRRDLSRDDQVSCAAKLRARSRFGQVQNVGQHMIAFAVQERVPVEYCLAAILRVVNKIGDKRSPYPKQYPVVPEIVKMVHYRPAPQAIVRDERNSVWS